VQFGRDWEGVSVGDDVQLVDTEFEPELRCEGRVTKLVTDMLDGSQEVTLGNVTETMADMLAAQQRQISGLSRRSSDWDVAASTPAAYLQQIIDGLNEQFNTQGMSYCFTSFETGTIWSSVPLDDEGKPTKAGGSAIQICSQGFRIADGTLADGSYNWRTFGTGSGFTADEINAGTLNAGLVKAGILSDNKGKNYWNMQTGEFSLSSAATVGGKTVSTIANDAVNSQTQSSIFNKLTNGGKTQGIYLSGGKIYINGEYIKAGTISTTKLTTSDGTQYIELTNNGDTLKLSDSNGLTIYRSFVKYGSSSTKYPSVAINNQIQNQSNYSELTLGTSEACLTLTVGSRIYEVRVGDGKVSISGDLYVNGTKIN
jgi:hypothetical protein